MKSTLSPPREYVVLVDELNREIGTMEKLEAHKKGVLHRAFSVFLFDENKNILLQKRSLDKYHSPGLWTNSYCSHPKVGESIEMGCHRRVKEELNIEIDRFYLQKSFIYKEKVGKGLIEHELDHIVFGYYSSKHDIQPNPKEVQSYRWVSIDDLIEQIHKKPEEYTEWLKIILKQFQHLFYNINV